jgi:hypothetical protein
MYRIVLAATALAAMTGAALAEPTYDRRIEEAAAQIVAAKIGDLRGGFAYDQIPDFVEAVDWHPQAWSAAQPA